MSIKNVKDRLIRWKEWKFFEAKLSHDINGYRYVRQTTCLQLLIAKRRKNTHKLRPIRRQEKRWSPSWILQILPIILEKSSLRTFNKCTFCHERKTYYQMTGAKKFRSQFPKKMAGHTATVIEESGYSTSFCFLSIQ